MVCEEFFHVGIGRGLQAHLEESGFLLEEPFSQLFVAAVSEAVNKMRDGVVVPEFKVFLVAGHREIFTFVGALTHNLAAFKCDLSRVGILIDF